MRLPRHGWLALSLTCAILAISAPAALAASFTVNTTADSTDAGGCTTATVCSLRDAVNAANAAAGSTITVPAGHYTLSAGQLALTAATTVTGAGARSTTVDGGGASRVFDFEPATKTDLLSISGLTVTGGAAASSATVTDPGDGGGIFSTGALNLDHVTVSGNTANLGGGGVMVGTIHSGTAPGPSAFNAVTISGNTVTGGSPNGQGGGAVVATTLTMTNSTITGNSVANPGINEGGGLVSAVTGGSGPSAILLNDTITGNSVAQPTATPAGDQGGGISGDSLAMGGPFNSVLSAINTIVAGNTSDGAEQDCALISNTGASSSHNLAGDTTCGFIDAGSHQSLPAQLGSLANNGGATNTELPAASSPAVDGGDPAACPATDQRGVTRPQLGGCDIGATELAPPSATTGAATGLSTSGATLAGAVTNPSVVAGTVTFQYGATSAYGQSISGPSAPAGVVAANPTATLSGLSAGSLYHYRIVVSTPDGTVNGADVTFTTASNPPASGPPAPPVPTPNPEPARTRTSVHCAPATLLAGQRSTCTITVANVSGAALPTGTVKLSSTPSGGTLSSKVCSLKATRRNAVCTVTYTGGGVPAVRTIGAVYSGDATHVFSNGQQDVTVRPPACPAASGSLAGSRVGPVGLRMTRSELRGHLVLQGGRTRASMDFFCFTHAPGIRVGYARGRAVIVLSANHRYAAGSVRPGSSLSIATRHLATWTHFRLGLNVWYFARHGAISYVLKVRGQRVQEVGVASLSSRATPAQAVYFMSGFN